MLQTRAEPLGIKIIIGDHQTFDFDQAIFGAVLQYPASDGTIYDYRAFIEKAHAKGALVTVAADPLSLTLLTPPGEFGADIAVGSTQRFGIPLGFGGPHAAYFATKEEYKRWFQGELSAYQKMPKVSLHCVSPYKPANSTSAAKKLLVISVLHRCYWR